MRAATNILYGTNPIGCGYECEDEGLLEAESDAVAEAMASLVDAAKQPISELTPYTIPG